MRSTAEILSSYREPMKKRFLEVVGRKAEIPVTVDVPEDSRAALRLGIRLGRKEGYSDGLVDGTGLGLDVGLEAVNAMLSQPVFFGQMGAA